MPMKPAPDLRKRELAAIHIARQQLGLDDGTYRDMLWTVARVRSAADLDFAGRQRVLDHLSSRGAKIGGKRPARPNEWAFIDRAAEDCRPMLRKLCVLCRELGIERGKQKKYTEGVARQMSGLEHGGAVVKPLELCTYTELWRIVAALNKHLERQRGRA